SLVSFPAALTALTIIAASFYVPVYLFVAMRRVYGQRRLITLLKFCVLTLAYLAGFAILMFGAVAVAAFSI
ncbi:MAG: hypothetical protein OEO82_13850, partial [Gammaproteobacteria bacterium]|nr:hypothetical protein [Gammaproteobacteria bacterium]